MKLETALGPPARTLVREEGTCKVWHPRSGLVVFRVTGHAELPVAEAVITETEIAVSQSERILIIHEWMELETFAVGCQAKLTPYVLRRLPRIERAVIATASPFVAMGVRTANVALGGKLELKTTTAELLETLESVR